MQIKATPLIACAFVIQNAVLRESAKSTICIKVGFVGVNTVLIRSCSVIVGALYSQSTALLHAMKWMLRQSFFLLRFTWVEGCP